MVDRCKVSGLPTNSMHFLSSDRHHRPRHRLCRFVVLIGATLALISPMTGVAVRAQQAPFRPTVAGSRLVVAPTPGQSSPMVIPAAVTGYPAPFIAVSVGWRDRPSGSFRISLRSSFDGVTWSEWREIHPDSDTEESGTIRGMIFIPAAARYLQYRLDVNTGDPPPELSLSFFNPGETPESLREEYLKRLTAKMKEAEEQYLTEQAGPAPKPAIITRAEWGVPAQPPQPPSYTTVTHLIVHHTVDNNLSSDWAAAVRAIWNFHVLDRGYNDIGYNYLIDPNGLIYEGRGGGDNVQGAHFSGVNGNTMGVAMLGTFTSTAPSAKAFDSLKRLLAWKAGQRGLNPFAAATHATSGLLLNIISGHRDGPSPTECPGEALYAQLPRLRAETHNLLAGSSYVTGVSAASYADSTLATESIIAAFGTNLAKAAATASSLPLPTSLGGATVRVRDRRQAEFTASLFYASPTQINFLLPAGVASGPVLILVDNGSGTVSAGTINVVPVAPSLFTANAGGVQGDGLPAATLLRVRPNGAFSYGPVAVFDTNLNRFVPVRIDPGPATDQVFLVLFGTGIRNRSALSGVTASIGGLALEVLYAGASPDYVGLDQVNLRLLPDLAGRGELSLSLNVDGLAANVVKIRF